MLTAVLNSCNNGTGSSKKSFLKKKTKLFVYLSVFGSWLHSSRSFTDVYGLSSCGVWAKLLLCM